MGIRVSFLGSQLRVQVQLRAPTDHPRACQAYDLWNFLMDTKEETNIVHGNSALDILAGLTKEIWEGSELASRSLRCRARAAQVYQLTP